MTPITADKSFDQYNYAYCKLIFIVPVGLDINEITRFNSKVEKLHLENIKTWNNIH